MLLAELEVRHSRAVAPTRRVALGRHWLPTDPAPGYGGILLGGTGFITHLCTVWPENELATWKLLEAGDYTAAQKKITDVTWAWEDIYGRLVQTTGAEGPGVKAALELCGRPGGPSRLPIRAVTDTERSELRAVLQQIGVPDVR